MSALLLYCALLSMPPPVALSDLSWMPDWGQTWGAMEWNRRCQSAIADRIDCHNRQDVLDELRNRYAVWDCLDDVWHQRERLMWDNTDPLDVQRQAEWHLLRPRGLIGLQAYYAGRLPEPVPVELFEGDGQ